jgi:NNP family nitrate/nitrite transporter-like MFS transporter
MQLPNQATTIRLADFHSPPMRAFHATWGAFFLCFFAWFGIAPLMPIVREELSLTKEQVGWCLISSVAITIVARLVVGWVCDRIGPRRAYCWLLVLGSLPVMLIGLARDFETFLIFRLLIGAIGASFVITQYHTSLMFAPNCVGTATATTAGWGNLGGGATQIVMPLIFSLFVGVLGFSEFWGWRLSMFVAGVTCLAAGIAYARLTQDTPDGNFREIRRVKSLDSARVRGTFTLACRDTRTWMLFFAYAACFGVELTLKNMAALYFSDYFGLGLHAAGLAAAAYGLMNLFARTLGGYISDRRAAQSGLRGRSTWLFAALVGEGFALVAFSQATGLASAVALLIVVGLFVQMSNGATYALVPFVNRDCTGSIAGIAGAGGNVGAVAAGFLFQGSMAWPTALFLLGITVLLLSLSALALTVVLSRRSAPVPVEAEPQLPALEAASV